MRISNNAAKAMLNSLVDLLDAGTGLSAGYIEIRTGAPPATVETAATGTLLGTLSLANPAFGDAADANPNAVAQANSITDDSSADNSGTAGWFRAYDRDGNSVIDGDAGEAGSGADLILLDTDITAGQPIQVTSWAATMPEA